MKINSGFDHYLDVNILYRSASSIWVYVDYPFCSSPSHFICNFELVVSPNLITFFLLLLLICFLKVNCVHWFTFRVLPEPWHIHSFVVTSDRHISFAIVYDILWQRWSVRTNLTNRISYLFSFLFSW